MKIYFVRHGKADWENWDKPDDERPLTKVGRKEMQSIAEFLAELGLKPGLILSSPLPRALQTAEILSECLDVPLEEAPVLAKGFSAAKLRPLIKRAKGEDLVVVGHEPDFSSVLRALTGADLILRKGGVARVDLENAASISGRLAWLLPPKILRS